MNIKAKGVDTRTLSNHPSQYDAKIQTECMQKYDDLDVSKKEFFCSNKEIFQRIAKISPKTYTTTRNFIDGDVSRLSPFITHGIISTRHLAAHAISTEIKDEAEKAIEKFIFQLAWRDFFHRVWEEQGDEIFDNLINSQLDYSFIRGQMPQSVLTASTGIAVLDTALKKLYTTGYIHNHERMWLAFMVANLARTDWRIGAKWMHYHLIDGDLASNALSWQWVAGTFSQKQYIANQENLNKFSNNSELQQSDTFLDVSYEALTVLEIPPTLQERASWCAEFDVAEHISLNTLELETNKRYFVRNMYHLDPSWHAGEQGQHVIIIEPRLIKRFPISHNRWQFIQHWAKEISAVNETPVVIIYGYFNDTFRHVPGGLEVVRQAHRLCNDWRCENMITEDYPWLFPEMEGDYQSFFKFWNQAQKQIKNNDWRESIVKNLPTIQSSER